MTQAQHTPTPYFAQDNGREPIFLVDAHGNEIKLTKENAAFIVKACNSHADLVAALVWARDAMKFIGENTDVKNLCDIIASADAALAKAKAGV